MLYISNIIKLTNLTIWVVLIAYVLMIIWIFFTFKIWYQNNDELTTDHHGDNFYNYPHYDDKTLGVIEEQKPEFRRFLIIFYYITTTITTVGFGDFHPVRESEALVCVFIMFVGMSSF